jgi:hypothetical protein
MGEEARRPRIKGAEVQVVFVAIAEGRRERWEYVVRGMYRDIDKLIERDRRKDGESVQ